MEVYRPEEITLKQGEKHDDRRQSKKRASMKKKRMEEYIDDDLSSLQTFNEQADMRVSLPVTLKSTSKKRQHIF